MTSPPVHTPEAEQSCASCQRVRELEAQLAHQQEREKQIFQTQEEFHLVGFNGRLLDCNASFAAALGWTREEVLELPLSDIDPSPPERLGSLIQSIVDLGAFRFATQHRHRDGHIIDVEVSAHIVNVAGERFIAAFSHPITKQLERARDLQESEQQLRAMQEQVIRAQEATIRELSTPLIPLEAGVVVMPLVGKLDTQRAQQLLERLLEGVVAQRARTVIIDITGVPVIDAEVAGALVRATQAARLLGTRAILSGIRPEVAQWLVTLDINLKELVICSSLQSALVLARQLGR
jgi:rsbT co-antagonist protein RsbR